MDTFNSFANPTNTRRTTLRGVGAGLAALAALPLLNDADAKKRGKRKKKDRCQPQVARCETVATTFCAGLSNPELCHQGLLPCCQPLGTCNGEQSIQCVIDAFTQKV